MSLLKERKTTNKSLNDIVSGDLVLCEHCGEMIKVQHDRDGTLVYDFHTILKVSSLEVCPYSNIPLSHNPFDSFEVLFW